MAVVNRISAFAADMAAWRQHIHRNPELGMDCAQTAAYVAARLREFGVDEVHEGVGGTGVVAVVKGRSEGPAIGLRADMDALPILEATGSASASEVPGRMHACGHDGHTAMLLGAARYLAETRNFAGSAVLIFQPGEEVGQGAKAMVEDGLMDRFGIASVYGLHTDPSAELGVLATRPGPMMAAVDFWEIHITGRSCHAAHPEMGVDPVAAAVQIASALQTILTRNISALNQAVLSITKIQSGDAFNVVPETALLGGTVRTHQGATRDLIERRMGEIAESVGKAMGVETSVNYMRRTQILENDAASVELALRAMEDVAGSDGVKEAPQIMGGEDFSEMLMARPGAFVRLGQGKGPSLHNDHFEFNDAAAPVGASFLVRLVETAQPA